VQTGEGIRAQIPRDGREASVSVPPDRFEGVADLGMLPEPSRGTGRAEDNGFLPMWRDIGILGGHPGLSVHVLCIVALSDMRGSVAMRDITGTLGPLRQCHTVFISVGLSVVNGVIVMSLFMQRIIEQARILIALIWPDAPWWAEDRLLLSFAVAIVIVIPISSARSMSVSIWCSVLGMGCLVVLTAINIHHAWSSGLGRDVVLWQPDGEFAQDLVLLANAMQLTFIACPSPMHFQDTTPKGIMRAFRLPFIIGTILTIAYGVASYLSVYRDIPSGLTFETFATLWIVVASRCLVFVMMVCKFASFMNAMRMILIVAIKAVDVSEVPRDLWFAMGAGLATVVAFASRFGSTMNFVCDVAMWVDALCPTVFYWRSVKGFTIHKVLSLVPVAIGLTSTVMTIISYVKK
jgi:hypothetical protein